MQVRKVLSSLTFRYIAKYVTVLAVSVLLLLGGIYAYYSYNFFRNLSDSIVDELDTMEVVYRGQSLAGVRQYIDDQQQSLTVGRFYYLVTDGQGGKVAGDLSAKPSYREFEDGWLGFEMALLEWGESIDVDFLARATELGEGYRVIVARDYADAVASGRLVLSTLLRAFLATLFLGLVGGFFSASRALQRIEGLNRELSRIIRQAPGERLPVVGKEGLTRDLALMVNEMLQQTESLMQGVRRVSDNIAHDLRTPLTRLRNRLSQLRLSLQGDSALAVDDIIAECDALLASFNAVLRISTLESGSRLSGGNEVQVRELLQDVVELYEPLAQESGIGLDWRPGDSPTSCRGEADLLFQMFANLLDNAIKYTPEGGRVEVMLDAGHGGDGALHVSIADSGPGIPSGERENVFRRFYRVETSRSQHPGHGLGLSLARAIARYHHGDLVLADNSPGLRVEISLP